MPDDASLRQHLNELLNGGHAHATFDKAVKSLPPNCAAKSPGARSIRPGRFSSISAWPNRTFSSSRETPTTSRPNSRKDIGPQRKSLPTTRPGTRACARSARTFAQCAIWWPLNPLTFSPHSSWDRPDHPERSAAHRGSQRLPPRSACAGAPSARGVEVAFCAGPESTMVRGGTCLRNCKDHEPWEDGAGVRARPWGEEPCWTHWCPSPCPVF